MYGSLSTNLIAKTLLSLYATVIAYESCCFCTVKAYTGRVDKLKVETTKLVLSVRRPLMFCRTFI